MEEVKAFKYLGVRFDRGMRGNVQLENHLRSGCSSNHPPLEETDASREVGKTR